MTMTTMTMTTMTMTMIMTMGRGRSRSWNFSGAGIFPELEPEPEISKMASSGNPGFKRNSLYPDQDSRFSGSRLRFLAGSRFN